jgi:N-acetylneuraminic acid mutarotase
MFCTAAVSFAAEGQWIRKANMPTPRFGSSIAEVGGKLFVIGGSQSNNRLSTVEVYDPATDSWTAMAGMPTARKNTAAAVVNGIIYVFGGTQSNECPCITTTEAYDPATDVWTTKQDMPTSRYGLAAVPLNGKIYAIGGWGVSGYESAVEVYDPVTDTWEDKAPLPRASGHFGYAGFNGKIYVFGGSDVDNVIRDTREYDPVTDRWTTKAAMPTARIFPSATVLDGKIYVLGGNLNVPDSWPVTGRVDLYDPVTDTWEAGVKMPTARSGLASATVKGKIYAIGGQTGLSFLEPGTIYATDKPGDAPTIIRCRELTAKRNATGCFHPKRAFGPRLEFGQCAGSTERRRMGTYC